MKQKKLTPTELDALLNEAAAAQNEALHLEALLPAIYDAAERRAASARPPRGLRRPFAVAAALALVLAAAVPAFAQTIVVEGKRYVTFTDAVEIEGTVYALHADAPDATPLVRLPDSAEYIRPRPAEEPETPVPTIYVFAPDAEPLPLKNPAFVSQRGAEPASREPVLVFPVVGDLMVREGPDTEYMALATLHSGQIVTKVGRAGDWAILAWEGGFAYAFDAYLYELPEEQEPYASVAFCATEPVNVRALPTSREGSAVLHELQTGERVVCTGRIGEWMQIEWEGRSAYVFTEYLAPYEAETND